MNGKPEVPLYCLFQGCYNPAYEAEIRKAKDKCHKYNQLNPNDYEAQAEILRTLLGKMGLYKEMFGKQISPKRLLETFYYPI